MRKSVENLATSKITGGRRHPLRIRRKYELIDIQMKQLMVLKLQLQDEFVETIERQL